MNDLNRRSRPCDQSSTAKAISAAGTSPIASPLAGPVAPQDGYTIRYRVL
jgi:hypothetical protein